MADTKHFWDKFCSQWTEAPNTATAGNEIMDLTLEEHSSRAESNIYYLTANMALHYDRHGNRDI